MRLVLRRVALYVVTAIVAIIINFFLPRLLPGNPALAVLGKAQSPESPQTVAALEVQYGVRTRTGEWGSIQVTGTVHRGSFMSVPPLGGGVVTHQPCGQPG